MNKSGSLEIKNMLAVEPDMRPKAYADEDPFSSKVFKIAPLLGDLVISEAILEKMYANVKQYVDTVLNSREKLKYSQWLYEQVAILVVNYAKKWNSNEEGKFSRYIAMQFGYKDDSGKIWRIITEALDVAFNRNGRYFIKASNGDRQFYETVMAHSFGPADAWAPMIELLFKFYTENLDWNYVPGDPLFTRLVTVLRKYFDNTVTDDDKFLIASNYYHLRIGIRRLVQDRPCYCAFLFEQIVRRIHLLIHNEAKETKRYSLTLVDEWFINRISRNDLATGKNRTISKETVEVALDYSKIYVKYILSNGKPSLRLPAIRLSDDNLSTANYSIYYGETLVSSDTLGINGNELGRTIQSKTIPLPLDKWLSDEINLRAVIKAGNDIIFDSDKTLFRQVLLFSDGKEISPSRLRREKYQLYAINRNKLTGANIDIVPYLDGMCEIALHKNFALEYLDNTIAVDSSEISGIRLVKPTVSEKAIYMRMGDSFFIASPTTSLKIYFSDEHTTEKYHVLINGKNHPLTEYLDRVSGNRSVIPFSCYGNNEEINISIIDLSTGAIIFNQKYIILPEFKVDFEQKYYLAENAVNPINVKVTIDSEDFFVESNNSIDASLEYLDGMIIVDVPCVQHHFIGIEKIYQDKYIQISDINDSSVLQVENHTGLDCVVLIGEVAFQNESLISLGWLKNRTQYKLADREIFIEIDGKKKFIGKIIIDDQFVSPPKIVYQGGALLWDGGQSFVGNQQTELQLQLVKNEHILFTYPLSIGESLIAPNETIADGLYKCKIFSHDRLLVDFSTFIGDEKKARFADRIIKIEHVTEDVENNSSVVNVKPVYIDQIKYVDTCYVETEDDIFDVYTGCMYWIDYKSDKRYFSFKYNDARSKYKVNPVKIIYISNRYLRIVNEDDEGIFYFNNEYSSTPGNEITDVEPNASARGYHDILFYIYTTELKYPVGKLTNTTNILSVHSSNDDVVDSVDNSQGGKDIKENEETLAIFPEIEDTIQETVIKSAVEKRILVNAGPGTGKTWTLIERIIYLIQEGVEPESIQVLCFSRAAVDVVRQRMKEAIDQERVDITSGKVDIRTFDSFASQLLYWVQSSDYGEIPTSQKIESLSYDERIRKFIKVLRAEPQLIEQCNHLIVDEVQDLVLSRAEMVIEMIKQLPAESGVTLFGDACQAIYDYQVDEGLSSTGFYNCIQKRGDFKNYSFTKNYRQISELQDYCFHYRDAILANDMALCKKSAKKIYEDLPEYTVAKIHGFQEDTLDFLTDNGNIGILTRANAQALMISGIFRKKNIHHVVQRRLSEDAISGWVALLFNKASVRYYNKEDFVNAFEENCSCYMDTANPHEMWDALSDTYSATTGRLSVKNLLVSIRSKGKCKGLFTEAPESQITISTIHRSKGREYDAVILLDDMLTEETDVPEEHRVNYVALTRAKSRMYKVSCENAYFRTLEDRRCFSVGSTFKYGKHYLRRFEIGKNTDFIRTSYAMNPEVQKFIRSKNKELIGKEVYLKRDKVHSDGSVTYQLILRENDMVLASTSQNFSYDLSEAIRETKNLPSFARIYEQLYPMRFSEIYIVDIASEIGMAQGEEKDVVEHEGLITWNTLMLEGYAKAEY